MPAEFFFNDRAALLATVQEAIVERINDGLARRGSATLFLSGGTTPVPLYRGLAAERLPWHQVHVALVDERWVEPTHDASNERLVRENLLQGPAASCHFTGMKNAFSLADPAACAHAVTECNDLYSRLPQPWSLALLGMGPDGHTASLFPGAPELPAAMRSDAPCVALHAPRTRVTGEHTARMSMTPAALLRCERLILLFTGEDKRAVYEEAKGVRDHAALPVSIFLQQSTVPIDVYWSP